MYSERFEPEQSDANNNVLLDYEFEELQQPPTEQPLYAPLKDHDDELSLGEPPEDEQPIMQQQNGASIAEPNQAANDEQEVVEEVAVEDEEGEFEQEEGQEEGGESDQAESEEEGEDEDVEQDVNAGSNDRGKKIRNLLDDGSDEDDDSDDIADEDDEDDVLKRQLIKQKRSAKNEHGQGILRDSSSGALAEQDQQASLAGLPRKRGRPSKKAKLEQEQQERQQARAQKRVKFDDGKERTVYVSGDESDENRPSAFDDEGDGKGGPQGSAGEIGTSARRGPGNYEEYVELLNGDQNLSSVFELFTQQRRKHVYESLKNPLEEERFNAFIEACPKKPMKKKLVELMLQLPGPKIKIHEDEIQVITSVVKIHAGQLVELAKKIQIDEIKQRLALQFPHHRQKPAEQEMASENKEQFLVNGAVLSKEAQHALMEEMRDMGALLPHHLQEARRQLNGSAAAISDRPKSMFLRKRFR